MIDLTFTDWRNRPLSAGTRVAATEVVSGAPAWADAGTVVGFGRARVRVQWESYRYDDATPFHTVATGPVSRRGRRKASALRCLHPDTI